MSFCGGFICSRNTLIFLNVIYIFIAFMLIGIAAYLELTAIFTNLSLIGSIVGCGVFLLLLSFLGLCGAVKHHQVILFFYMVVLFILFLVQFGIACACLAISTRQQQELLRKGWNHAKNDLKLKTQKIFACCGFEKSSQNKDGPEGHPPCNLAALSCCKQNATMPCCSGKYSTNSTGATCSCDSCWVKVEKSVDSALKSAGATGLMFSFLELVGVWLTVRYRNQKDPRADPRAFL